MQSEGNQLAWLLGEYQKLWVDFGVDEAPPLESLSFQSTIKQATETLNPASLEAIRNWLGDCKRCGLCETRNSIVFGEGAPRPQILFVGEGPGADEDREGRPFIGKAGQLLTKIIEAMGMSRSEVYIANVVKCRPPENRAPEGDEVASCLPFLQKQIEVLSPKVIVALGAVATNALLQRSVSISQVRGKFQSLPLLPSIEVIPTFHPSYLLRNPDAKKLVWEDMKQVIEKLKN